MTDQFMFDIPPRVSLHIYDEIAVMERGAGVGRITYPVRLESVAEVLGGLSLMSGILPENTLAIGEKHGQPMIIKYLQPCIRLLKFGGDGERIFTVPMPPMIWAAYGTQYRLYALNQHTYPDASTILFHAPVPNLNEDGAVCWGSTGVPAPASHASMKTMLDRFFESNFVAHDDNHRSRKYPISVLDMWHELSKAKAEHYPLTDLIAASLRLDQLLNEGWM